MKKILLFLAMFCLMPVLLIWAGGKQEAQGMAGKANKIITLNMWHWAANKEKIWDSIIGEYQGLHPNMKITQKVIPHDSYLQALAAAQIGGQSPDLYHAQPGGETKMYVDNGQALDLSSYMDKDWQKVFYPSTLKSFKIYDKYYNVSMATNNMEMFYNKNMLKKYGIKVPIRTMDELRAGVKKLKNNGIGGILYWGNLPVISSFVFLIQAQVKYPKLYRNANMGEGSWDIPEFVSLMDHLGKLGREVFFEGTPAMSLDQAVNLFLKKKSGMFIVGNWAIRSFRAGKPDFEIGVFPVPALEEKGSKPTAWGSLAGTWLVSSHTKYKNEAVEFLRWATMTHQGDMVRSIGLSPAGPAGEAALKDADVLDQDMSKEQNTAIPRDNFDVKVRDIIGTGYQGILNNEVTAAKIMKKAEEQRLEDKK